MRRFIFISALLLSMFTFNSCEEDKWGWDNKVVFSARGGEKDIDGDYSIYTLSIGSYKGTEKTATEIADLMTITYDWLTATALKHDNEIHLIAQPNKTGKKRKLYVYGMIDNRSIDITVIQDK